MTDCCVFFQHSDNALLLEGTADMEPGGLPADDIYVTDKGFNWTYVRTHETMCGPYSCCIGEEGSRKEKSLIGAED
jgi:hypothetical protein